MVRQRDLRGMASNSKKKRPTASCDGHESIAYNGTPRAHDQRLLLGDVVDVVDVAVQLYFFFAFADLREVEVVLEAG